MNAKSERIIPNDDEGGIAKIKDGKDAHNPGVHPAEPPGVEDIKIPGVDAAVAPTERAADNQVEMEEEEEAALALEPVHVPFGDGRYPGRQRTPATTHFNLNLITQQRSNNLVAISFSSEPICPSIMTLPTRQKALQAMMRQRVNLSTWATPQAVNKVAAITHFLIMQYSFKKAPKLYRGCAEVAV